MTYFQDYVLLHATHHEKKPSVVTNLGDDVGLVAKLLAVFFAIASAFAVFIIFAIPDTLSQQPIEIHPMDRAIISDLCHNKETFVLDAVPHGFAPQPHQICVQ